MIKNTKFSLVLFFAFFFSLAIDASDEKERSHPMVIRIIPQKRELIQRWDPSTQVRLNDVGFANDERCLDEFGIGMFFSYDVEAIRNIRSPAVSPSAPALIFPAFTLLKGLGDYRKTHLGNPNAMVVRLKIHTDKGKQETLTLGLFVSGENNYQLVKKGGIEPINTEDFLCSGSFKLDYKLVGFLRNDIIDGKNASKGLKPALAAREKITTEADKVVEEMRRTKEFQELEATIKKAIKERVESQIVKDLREYTSPTGMIFCVPSFQNQFPYSLPTLYNLNPWMTEHYMTVVERIFDVNLRRGNRSTPPFTAAPPISGEFAAFQFHVAKFLDLEKLCYNLFGRNPFDGYGQDGCFQSAFSYYFTDSEQAFLKWLDKYQTIPAETTPPPAREHPITITITQMDVEFLSYLDMCPPCRGTMSYLSTKVEKEQALPWLQRRVVNYLQDEMLKGKIDQMKISAELKFNLFCISLAKCNKGASS
ncbi:MAG: hypothetical protein FJX71_04190 [Alphaproteobacteria bacterium]|nr:hypothetical protein [Alphaproteobacteria bacterium]